MFLCWSAKGGSGTTVVAAALALVLSQRHPTLLIDLGGDSPAALGIAEPHGPGLADWFASPTADSAALSRLDSRRNGGAAAHPAWVGSVATIR